MKPTTRRKAAGTRMAKQFLKHLEQGLLIDRTHRHADGKCRKKISSTLPSFSVERRKP